MQQSIVHIALVGRDYDEAIAFYVDVDTLGFRSRVIPPPQRTASHLGLEAYQVVSMERLSSLYSSGPKADSTLPPTSPSARGPRWRQLTSKRSLVAACEINPTGRWRKFVAAA